MSFLSFFKRKRKPSPPPRDASLRDRYANAISPPFTVIGVSSENGAAIASALAFVIQEACGWKVATINTQYFVRTGLSAMLSITEGAPDPVIGVSLAEAQEVVEKALEDKFPGIWLRCLDYAQSRLPGHVFVVHGIVTEETAAWIHERQGKIVSDGTVPGLRGDITIFPDADNSYVGAATTIMDSYLYTSQE